MTTPLELYRSGDLLSAVRVLGDELRSTPLDTRRRTFLFELLCFAGEFDRAEKQLNLLADSSKEGAAGVLLYRSALHAERTRQELFRTKQSPPSTEKIDAGPGVWNGTSFLHLTDSDPRIGPNLEAFIAGSYTWIPMMYLEEVELEPPKTLRDLIWARARVQTSPAFRLQDLGEVLLPVLSPFSSQHVDETVRLGRSTVWEKDKAGEDLPFGQKLLLIDGEDVPLLEVHTIKWSSEG